MLKGCLGLFVLLVAGLIWLLSLIPVWVYVTVIAVGLVYSILTEDEDDF